MMTKYLFIRLWAPHDECQDADEPHYVQCVDSEAKVIQWTLTREFLDAFFFKGLRTAQRVIRGVQRIKFRVQRGWKYEIIRVEEEIVDTNVVMQKEEA